MHYMPKTFDAGDFDIHEFENQKPDVRPLTKSEKIDPRTVKFRKQNKPEGKTHTKKVFIGIIGNFFLPGLGNVYLKKTSFAVLLLVINLVLLTTTLSPTSLLGFLGNVSTPIAPAGLDYAIITVSPETSAFSIKPEMMPVFYIALATAFITWIHFFYTALEENSP